MTEARTLREAPDSAVVSIGFSDEWTDEAQTRHVSDPARVRELLRRRGHSWHDHDRAILTNELCQFDAARAIGVRPPDLTFRVRLRRSKPAGSFTRRWFGTDPEFLLRYSGPKLAVAAVYAAAPAPTSFDLQRLNEFGYRDVAHVADRVTLWNAVANTQLLPVPPTA